MIKQWRPYLAGLAMGIALGVGAVWGGVEILNQTTPPDTSNAVAQTFDVSIVWTDDFRNCSVDFNNKGGCFRPETPDTIYVSPNMPSKTTNAVILHEIAHVLQHRLGLRFNECDADMFAITMGAYGGRSKYECGL